MRERLSELLWCASREYSEYTNDMHENGLSVNESYEDFATDYLISHGVIVPPCKVGDTVWYLNKHPHISLLQNSVYKATVARIVTISTGTVLVIQIKSEGCCEIPDETDWGITVFATREEAEQALKGGTE